MSNDFEYKKIDGAAIAAALEPDFSQTAQQLDTLIRNLHLDQKTSDLLADLIACQVFQALTEAFMQGYQMGTEHAGFLTDSTKTS